VILQKAFVLFVVAWLYSGTTNNAAQEEIKSEVPQGTCNSKQLALLIQMEVTDEEIEIMCFGNN